MYPIDVISAKIGQINFQGNVIPASWKDHIRQNNSPDLNAMYLLSEIVYWYRPIVTRDEKGDEIYLKKYKCDLLQKGYSQLKTATGLSEKQLREALKRLEILGLVKRHMRTIESRVKDSDEVRKIPNVLFIEIFPDKIEEITNSNLKKIVPSIPTGNHLISGGEPPPTPQGRTNTETTTETTTESKGKDYEAMPFSKEKGVDGKKSRFPLKKEQQPYLNEMLSLDLGADESTLLTLVRHAFNANRVQMLENAISHIKAEIEKGTVFKKPRIALFRQVYNGKISPISKNAIHNRAFAEKKKKELGWSSLDIKEKFVICKATEKEVPLDQEPKQFFEAFKSLWNLSCTYRELNE